MKKYFIPFYFFLFVFGQASAQVDSLFLVLQNSPEDSLKVKHLNELAFFYNNRGYANDTALWAAQNALRISAKLDFRPGLANAYLYLGIYFQHKGENDKALDNLLKALGISEKSRIAVSTGNANYALSLLYRQSMKNYDQALVYAENALRIRNVLGNKTNIISSLINRGDIYFDKSDYARSLRDFLDARQLILFSGSVNTGIEAEVENNIGSVYTELKEYDSAIEYFNKATAVYIAKNLKDGIALGYINIGNVYIIKGAVKEGNAFLQKGLGIAKEINAKDLIAAAYGFLAEGYGKLIFRTYQ